jgi:cell division septation protein DedD
MIEPEVAFMDLDGLMNLAEAFLTHIVTTRPRDHRADLKVIGRDIAKLEAVIAPSATVPERRRKEPQEAAEDPPSARRPSRVGYRAQAPTHSFPRLSYDEAHAMLDEAYKAGKLEAPHIYGDDFGSPDETYISSQFDKPVMIHRYPAAFKAFYMQPDPADPTKALCVDVLAPEGYGEIIGGSQRVDSYDLLRARIESTTCPSPPSSGTSTSAATAPSPTPASAWASSAPSPGSAASTTSAKPSPSPAPSTASIPSTGTGTLYRLSIPATKKFLHKNSLCGDEEAQWMVAYVSGRTLQLAFFSGEKPPIFTFDAISNSTDLCGTFSYTK